MPTWNHVTAHLYGTPQLLDPEENYEVLCRLTEHFEGHRPGGRSLLDDEISTRRAAKGTTGLRLPVDRFEARAKLSQNKTPDVVSNIIEQLAEDNPALAQEMSPHPRGTFGERWRGRPPDQQKTVRLSAPKAPSFVPRACPSLLQYRPQPRPLDQLDHDR